MVWSIFKGTEHDRAGLAAALIIIAISFLSFQDALVKLASSKTSLWQFQVFRSSCNLVLMGIPLLMAGQLALLRPQRIKPVFARSAIMVLTMVFFFSGAPFLTLAEMGAGLYTYPIFTTLLGWIVLRERVGVWRVLAIVLALVGAMLLIRPWSLSFQPAQLLPICAGFCYAINSMILRRYCRNESPVTMAIWSASGFLIAAIVGIILLSSFALPLSQREAWPFLLDAWPPVVWIVVGFAMVASFCNVIGNVLIVKAYQSAEISWLAPIDYSYLILAGLWGVVIFSDWPDVLSIGGMILIASGGILTAWREARLK